MTIVEAAFAVPVVFMFMMALLDLGMWTYNANQASSAARDGAREGIIAFAEADQGPTAVDPASADWQAIVDAVEARLPGRDIGPEDIEISCVDDAGDPVTGGCDEAELDEHRLRVAVTWHWDLVTPIAGLIGVEQGEATGTATMAIVGKPLPGTTTTPPPDGEDGPDDDELPAGSCVVSSLSVSPDPVVSRDSNGKLQSDLTITYSAEADENDVGCDGLTVQLKTPGADGNTVSAVCVSCELDTNHTWTYSSTKGNVWTASGSATVRVFNSYVDTSKQFTVNSSG